MPRFLCDEMLRGLGRWLRVAGYDTVFAAGGLPDRALAARCAEEDRVLLTKDRHLAATVARTARVVLLPGDGIDEAARALRIALDIDWQYAPFTRCLVDNRLLEAAPPCSATRVPEGSRAAGGPLRVCRECGRLYWPGGHVRRMQQRLAAWQQEVVPPSYPDDRIPMGTNIMPERFTETLRAASEPGWSHAVGHRFVKELFIGAMPDAVMARYLIQDHRFLDSFLTLLGAVLASADMFEAKLRFGRFIGSVSSEENTYFLRAFEALGVTEDRRAADPDTQPTAGFKAIMRVAAETHSYALALSVLVVTEWLYLDWASRAPKPLPNNFVHAEWITLHVNPDFRGFVDFLRAELDRVGPAQADLCRDFFRRAVDLELSFFEAAYADGT